jgi:methylated-DNA-protein-cysteine methyltransferase-like protein
MEINASYLVYETVSKIPLGKVTTYGRVAQMVNNNLEDGKKITPRQVGAFLHQNKNPSKIPCHRVVFSDGKLSWAFAFGGVLAQRKKLVFEGVPFKKSGKVDLKKALWRE